MYLGMESEKFIIVRKILSITGTLLIMGCSSLFVEIWVVLDFQNHQEDW